MTVPLECSDCSPSCQPQNENNFFVIYNRKYDALKTKMIEYFKKREHHFCSLKMFKTQKRESQKNSQTLIITNC